MTEESAGRQLEMNFQTPSGNRFRRCLDNGVFTVLFEHAAAGMELSDEEAAQKLAVLEKTALNYTNMPCALAITDRYWSDKSRRAVDYAALLDEKHRNSHLVYLSGRKSSESEMRGMIAEALSCSLANLVVVSGEHRKGETCRDLRKMDFTESVHALDMLRQLPTSQDLFPGGVVNAHIFSAPGLYSSICKLIKKFNAGAEFAVTQAGFDMAQLDALRTYLSWRGYHQPLVARLMLLTPDKVEKITSQALPGIQISKDFLHILNRELRFSASQFEAAQYRRLELQAAGCKLLGYSGIQLSGADTVEKMQIAMQRIDRALKEFTNINQWCEEYKFYMARSDMAPGDQNFYLLESLLESRDSSTPLRLSEFALPEQQLLQRWGDKVRRFLFPDTASQAAGERRWLKKLLTGCPGCNRCRLPQTQYCCPELCPKHLVNGPCGSIKDDGRCSVGNFPCVHLTIWQHAVRRKECDRLENDLIPPAG